MSVDLSRKVAMVIDNGLFVELACRLGESFGKVFYYTEAKDAFPKMNRAFIGYGLENIETVDSIIDYIDDVDIFVFPDLYYADLQNYLSSIGKRVWGMRNGEELENDRVLCKKLMTKLNLPVGKYEVVKGMDGLRKYLKSHDNVYVKISHWRGITETFKSETYKKSEPKLDEIEYALGAFKYLVEFIVEDELKDKVEIGCDLFVVDGKYPSKLLTGIEIKDLSYLASFSDYSSLPKEVTQFNSAIAPTLSKYGSRGFFSTEIRVGKDHKPYMIDFCARCFSSDTLIETESGWKKIMDLSRYEKVAAINKDTLQKEFQSPIAYVSYRHEGKMYVIETPHTKQCITPNHDVVYKEDGVLKKVYAEKFDGGVVCSDKHVDTANKDNITTIDYNDFVYCITVPNGIVNVMLDGKSVWSGNCGSPPNELYVEMFSNIDQIIWYGSEGKLVDPVSKYKYGAEILIHSSWADKNWQPIDFPKSIRPFVKLRNAAKINGEYYVIPQSIGLPEVGAVIGMGNTKEEAIEQAKEHAKQISGYYIDIPEQALDKADDELQKTLDLGIKLF